MPSEEVIARDMYNASVQSGTYVELKPEHFKDYAAMLKRQASRGHTNISRIALDADSPNPAEVVYQKLPDGSEQMIVNKAAIRDVSSPKLETDLLKRGVINDKYNILQESHASNYAELANIAKSAGFTKPPIVVLAREDMFDKPNASVVEGEGGVPIVFVNRAAHAPTAEYFKSRAQSESYIQEQLKSGDLRPAEGVLPAELLGKYQKNAETLKIGKPAPQLYVQKGDDIKVSAELTREGRPIITMSEAATKLPPELLEAVLTHELRHIQKGHVSFEALAKGRNGLNKAQNHGEEFEGDLGGACLNGENMSRALDATMDRIARANIAANGKPVTPDAVTAYIRDFEQTISGTHPSMVMRKEKIGIILEDPTMCAAHGLPAPPPKQQAAGVGAPSKK